VMRLALMLPRRDGGNPTAWPTGAEMLARATKSGAAALSLYGKLGCIAAGQLADLVLVRQRAPGTLALEPGVEALVQHAGPETVDSVMVDGAWVMRAGRLLAFDEEAALADAAVQLEALRARVATQLPTLLAAMPAVTIGFERSCG